MKQRYKLLNVIS